MKHKLGHWKTEILHNLETILTKYDANLLVRKFASRLKPQLIISLVDESLEVYEIKIIVPICWGFKAEDKFKVTLREGDKTSGKLFNQEIEVRACMDANGDLILDIRNKWLKNPRCQIMNKVDGILRLDVKLDVDHDDFYCDFIKPDPIKSEDRT